MSEHDYKEIKKLIKEEENHLFDKKFWRNFLVMIIPLMLMAGIGSYMGVQTALEVHEQRINNLEKETENLKKENRQQWNHIYDIRSMADAEITD